MLEERLKCSCFGRFLHIIARCYSDTATAILVALSVMDVTVAILCGLFVCLFHLAMELVVNSK